jgi:hypothetical protein
LGQKKGGLKFLYSQSPAGLIHHCLISHAERQMPYSESNASCQALALLGQFFGSDAKLLGELWSSLGDTLATENETVRTRSDEWEQDWLLVKFGMERPGIATGAWYDPPADFRSFPTFDIDIHTAYLKDRPGVTRRQTRSNVDVA